MIEVESEFLIAKDLSFKGILHDIKKSGTALSPVFEAFTNALEAIKIKKSSDENFRDGKITIAIYSTELTDSTSEFKSLEILDNGIGFNKTEFSRFNTFKDNSKGFKNLGSGRIQYVHFFEKTIIKSVFEGEDGFYEREFVLSKSKPFISKNAIVKLRHCKLTDETETYTQISFNNLLEPSNVYNLLDDKTLKEDLLKRYLHYFCFNSLNIPEINIHFHINNILKSSSTITKFDIPKFDQKENIEIHYSKPSTDATKIEYSEK